MALLPTGDTSSTLELALGPHRVHPKIFVDAMDAGRNLPQGGGPPLEQPWTLPALEAAVGAWG